MRQFFVVCILLCTTLFPAIAQEAATLVADRVLLQGETRLIAEGNVEVFQDGQRLKAERVIYDQTTETLTIEGPITLIDGNRTIIMADSAELDQGFRNGILTGARIVFEEKLQLAANQITRVDGRYTQMYKVVATSCQVCGQDDAPLWQIRARNVIHDETERQIYFEDATVLVLDVPVFYLPRLRLPDPSVERTRGFLPPEYRSTTQLGFGIKVPYFIPIGDHKDITLTPYLSPSTRTLQGRYRQAFRNGDLIMNGAVTDDDLRPGEFRGYLFAEGQFDLPRDFKLIFDIETTSDDAYLLDYGFSSRDRLDSELALTRTVRDENFYAGITQFQSLREDEGNSTLPPLLSDISYTRRLTPSSFGGILDLTTEVHSHYRYSDEDVVGRDVTSASARAHWNRSWTFGPGVVGRTDVAMFADYYIIGDDQANFEDEMVTRLTPYLAAELRWPLAQTTHNGVRHVVEPVAQIVWTDDDTEDVPNEDSTRAELDEGNLYSLSRFPGTDAYERGMRTTFGGTYTRYDPANWSIALTLARSYRTEDLGQFTDASGLSGSASDWLAVAQFAIGDNLTFTNRTILDDDLGLGKNETRLDWISEQLNVGTSYIWLDEEIAEDRPDSISEWNVDAGFLINRNWSGTTDWRYDFVADRAARAALGLTYENECVAVGLSLSRRFTSSDSVRPTTDFDLTVALTGFSTGGSSKRSKARSCR
ncbi:LPS-assembly protein LptD [Parasulfitobacter algicola]|uniref:LPS-assembly protein LptD n=1 Tax=Parasulfitobacter algicola TaxID=2614809 RepID=A0ABX2IS43_9RHOB|nr:LPS assembly protein LptD [Sulfitobacter algicola]NSX55724.1 LPS-assembly protein LptD [Sulfitobacter algicola]